MYNSMPISCFIESIAGIMMAWRLNDDVLTASCRVSQLPSISLVDTEIYFILQFEKNNLHRSLQGWPAYLLLPHCTLLENASLVIAHKKKFALWYPIPPNLPLTCSTIAYFTPLMEHNSIPSPLFLSPTLPPFFSKFLLHWVLNTLLCRWHFSCSSLLFLQWKLQWKLWEMAMLHLVH